jgi:hypothetical protein
MPTITHLPSMGLTLNTDAFRESYRRCMERLIMWGAFPTIVMNDGYLLFEDEHPSTVNWLKEGF